MEWAKFFCHFPARTSRLLTRLRLRPTRRVFVWMDSRVARRSEAELTGACCLACILWRRPVDVPAPSAGWFARTAGERAALAAKNQWITADQSGLRSSLQGHALDIGARSSVGPRTRGRPEPTMTGARSVADGLRDHVVLELEGIDRMYLNGYLPSLQTTGAVVGYLRVQHGQRFASTAAVVPMTEAFVRNIE